MSDTLNQVAWEKLFERHKILKEIEDKGVCYVSAKQIKKEREPRLMAKFDHTINLPKIFVDNKLSILPITRGDYAIAHFDAYHSFEPLTSEIQQVTIPPYIQSINSSNIQSEAIALNCAVATGIIADFTGDIDIIPTVSGRMGSGDLEFYIRDTLTDKQLTVDVRNSQIEIDAAYEGVNYLSLLEAKRDISEDFLVRQLYYPYRVWHNRVTKPVKPIFLVYSNGIYHLYEYEFTDRAIQRYRELGIDPRTKTIVFSNALTVEKFKDIEEYCRGKIKCSAGIGTSLTCDVPGVKPCNIVMKLRECRMNDKQDMIPCIKLSDDEGKHTGDPDEVRRAKEILGIK